MALIMPGPNVSNLTGSIGGTTYARNRYGLYARHRVVPTNPHTTRQAAARARITNYAPVWLGLTVEVRDRWQAYAEVVPWINRLGQTVHLTGFQWYIKSCLERASAGLTPVATGPSIYTRVPADPKLGVTATELALNDEITITFDDTLPWCTSPLAALSVQASPELPKSHNYNTRYNYCGRFLGSSGTHPTSPKELTTVGKTAGFSYAGAGLVWFRLTILEYDGRSSAPVTLGPYPTS